MATYDLLDSTTLSSSASSVTFSSIDQSYRDLILICNFTSSFNGQTYLTYNGSSSGYNFVEMNGNGSSAASTSKASQSIIEFEFPKTSTSVKNLHTHSVLDYSATDKHKSALSRTNRADGGTGATASRWADTSAITSLTFQMQAGNFNSGSTFYLYGVAA